MRFVVLNKQFQTVNPLQYNFIPEHKISEEVKRKPAEAILFVNRPEAVKFCEFLARHHLNDVFYIAELTDEVISESPIVWKSYASEI